MKVTDELIAFIEIANLSDYVWEGFMKILPKM